MDVDPPIAEWEDETWHPRAQRLIEWFIAAREDGVELDVLQDELRGAWDALTTSQRQRLIRMAHIRLEGPYDYAADLAGRGDA